MLPGDCQPILCQCVRDWLVLLRRKKRKPPLGKKEEEEKKHCFRKYFSKQKEKLISTLSSWQGYSRMAEVELGFGTEAWKTLQLGLPQKYRSATFPLTMVKFYLFKLKWTSIYLLEIGRDVLLQYRRIFCMKHHGCSTGVRVQVQIPILGRHVIKPISK